MRQKESRRGTKDKDPHGTVESFRRKEMESEGLRELEAPELIRCKNF